ncbi:MAG: DinB family protein [Acidobacteria bacterium]|nr:DinB family protein [Acidobacteriota bacterium]
MNFDLGTGIAVLERTPGVLETLLSGLPDGWTTGNEGADTWSPFDVVGHLIDGELTDWMARLHIILSQTANRRFEPFDRSGHISRNKGRPLPELLAEFRELRERNLSQLRGLDLTRAQLQLTGEHPAFGRVTLEQLLATWVAHDLGHLAQITRVMAKQYREAVGPWEAYLPVLHR